MFNLILAFAIEPWAQFGLAGICFGALVTMLGKILQRLNEREQRDNHNYQELQTQLLEEINKRDDRFIELQEKTLTAFAKNYTAMNTLADRTEDIEKLLERKCRESREP